MVLESKYGSPKIVNDGVTVAKEVLLPVFVIYQRTYLLVWTDPDAVP